MRSLLVSLGGFACAAVHAAACSVMPADLPPADVLTDPSGQYNFGYHRWEDYCYGGAPLDWVEWIESNNWDSGSLTLTRRFDFFRRADAPMAAPMPLVIFAHPQGMSENIPPESPFYAPLLMKVLDAGYAFATIESRHPLLSFIVDRPLRHNQPDWPLPSTSPLPSNDIATAVRWFKFNRRTLGIDPDRIMLVGQSRGSAALLNALLNEPGQRDAPDWRVMSSNVRGAYVVQAQTTYVEQELTQTFVQEQGDNGEPYRYWFRQDTPDVIPDPTRQIPGSAVAMARVGALDTLVPVHMAYEEGLALQADGRSVRPQCYETNNYNREYQNFDNDNNSTTPPVYDVALLPRCPAGRGGQPRPMFDLHDPNYSQHFAQAYSDRGVPQRVSRCLEVGTDNFAGLYAELVPFTRAVLLGKTFTPTCSGGGVSVPAPPPTIGGPHEERQVARN